jgi:transcriptional regulator EpsA
MAQALEISMYEPAAMVTSRGTLHHARWGSDFHSSTSADELCALLDVLEESGQIRTHRDLFEWLQGEVQDLVPHSTLLAAWGDFSSGRISYDVVSPLPDVRTQRLDAEQTSLLLRSLFGTWQGCDRSPVVVTGPDTIRLLTGVTLGQTHDGLSRQAETVLVHGIRDRRCRHDCLYVLIGGTDLGTQGSRTALTLLLPHIDAALRRIDHLGEQCSAEIATAVASGAIDHGNAAAGADASTSDLSPREAEILGWVGLGKTNYEIGKILDISTFTVKNHLQRIFRKLNVINRAQATARLNASALPAHVLPF